MDPARWKKVEQLYHSALEKAPEERSAFLLQACAGDGSLRAEVESLLSVAGMADSYLQAAVREVASQASGLDATQTMRFPAAAGGAQKLGRYELVETIGAGGMGVVYLARDPTISRMVAIKTIQPARGGAEASQLRTRLVHESQAGGRLSHPNIVAIHDICDEGGVAYIVMEYVRGRTLEKAMGENPCPQLEAEALRVVRDCAAALDYAHSRGVVHRDIKPANIMIQADGVVKIADFGIARLSQNPSLTRTGVAMGSPQYMAPEQWRGEAATGQTDQYALATVAFALLTGRRPFDGDSVASLAAMTIYREPASASGFNPRLNPRVDEVFRKALAKAPEARYPTCSAFAVALRSAWEEGRAAAHRTEKHPGRIAAALAIVLLAALSGAGWLLWHRHGAEAKPPVVAAKTTQPPETKPSSPEQEPPRPVAPHIDPAPRPSHPPPEVDPELRGQDLLRQGNYAEAAQYFTKAIATRPDYASYLGRGGAYRHLGQADNAIRDYSQAIRLKPDSASAFYDRALCEMTMNLIGDAAHDYDQAIRLGPKNQRAWNSRGSIYLKSGGYKKSIPYFTEAIRLDPNFALAYENRAAAEKALKDTAAAEADLNQAKALRAKQ